MYLNAVTGIPVTAFSNAVIEFVIKSDARNLGCGGALKLIQFFHSTSNNFGQVSFVAPVQVNNLHLHLC